MTTDGVRIYKALDQNILKLLPLSKVGPNYYFAICENKMTDGGYNGKSKTTDYYLYTLYATETGFIILSYQSAYNEYYWDYGFCMADISSKIDSSYMKISTTISIYLKKGFSFDDIAEILTSTEIFNLDFPFQAEGYYTANEEYFNEIKDIAKQYGVSFNQTHAPYNSRISNEKEMEVLINKTIECIKITKILGGEIMVIHPLQHLPYEEKAEELFELNMQFFRELIPCAQEYGVKLAIENVWQKNSCNSIVPSVCGSPEEHIKYIDALNSEQVVACLDIGHTVLCKNEPSDCIKRLGDRLYAVHVHENNGIEDLHVLPYTYGIIDWDSLLYALKSVGYKGEFTFETVGYLDKHEPQLLHAATVIMAGFGSQLLSKG